MAEPFIIAIDGTMASGKSTLAKRLAKRYGFPHLNTGLLYRAVGLSAQHAGLDLTNHEAVTILAQELADSGATGLLDNPALVLESSGKLANTVAQIPGVRQALLDWQHHFPVGHKGAVLDGRDITSTIFPNAPAKFMVTADLNVRAQRRLNENPEHSTLQAMLAFVHERDERDRWNTEAPSPGRILLDTTAMDADATEAEAARYVDAAMQKLGFAA